MPSYDLHPETRIEGFDDRAFEGDEAVLAALGEALRSAGVVVCERYPGVEEEAACLVRRAFRPDVEVRAEDCLLPPDRLRELLAPHVTCDRVRGVMYLAPMETLFDQGLLSQARERVRAARAAGRRVLVQGMGASLMAAGDVLVYCDMARWEAQLRQRAGAANLNFENHGDDPLVKNKIGYFVEWRVADRAKRDLLPRADWLLDTCERGNPRLVAGEALRAGLASLARRPFRLVPYFDPGVWGGTWMQKTFGLDPDKPNFAWAFDGVPEENSLYLRFGKVRVEVPAMDLTLTHPRELLGQRVFARFGAEFPIRFDLLDTMGGQNLSLQVHPTTDYIRSRFGMAYTQDESYYILAAGDDACVFLGARDDTSPEEMFSALREAQEGGVPFDAGSHVNRFPARAGDHFLIPAGTIHCSGADTVVLEVSATPYIFTFKMWDWGRVGMDGLPRPIHLDDAERVIDWGRRTAWCEENLVNRFEGVASGPGWREERTGLHELEFIETRRITATAPVARDASSGVRMLNLVAGRAALVKSPAGAWEPFEVHFAETFVVPAAAGAYVLEPVGEEATFLEAHVRV